MDSFAGGFKASSIDSCFAVGKSIVLLEIDKNCTRASESVSVVEPDFVIRRFVYGDHPPKSEVTKKAQPEHSLVAGAMLSCGLSVGSHGAVFPSWKLTAPLARFSG